MRLVYWLLLLTFLGACSKEENISIHFNDEVFLDAQINFVRQLENLDSLSVTSIKTILAEQDWVESFSLKHESSQSTKLILNSRLPLLNWEKAYHVDKNLNIFSSLGKTLDIPMISAPYDKLADWVFWHDLFKTVLEDQGLTLKEIRFIYGAGWEIETDDLIIKIGSIINQEIYEKFQEALNYVFRKNLNPSIMDLRNLNGIALNYAKQ